MFVFRGVTWNPEFMISKKDLLNDAIDFQFSIPYTPRN